jgi:hypothetical protein
MTDRIHGLTIVLEHDLREDDVEPLIQAIRQLRGVLCVHAHVADVAAVIAHERAKAFYRDKLAAVLMQDCT